MMKRAGRLIGLASVAMLVLGVGAAKADPGGTMARALGQIKIAPPEAWAEAERDSDGDVRVVIIQREGAVAERAAVRLQRQVLGRIGRSFDRIGGDVMKVPPGRLAEVLAELEADPDVEVVAPDRKDQRIQADGDEVVWWGVERIGASPGNRAVLGLGDGAEVKVAVLDTGIWRNPSSGAFHPDLAGAYRGGYDFANDDRYPWDDNGHGTHVAGIIAARDNEIGIVGVAPGVALYALKVLDKYGLGYYSDFIAALDWCIEHGVRIVNYSGGGSPSLPLEQACNRARAAGVTIIAAAGNDGGNQVRYPAAYPSVIAVGSTDSNDGRSPSSNTGGQLDFVAPGESIRSTYREGGYVELSGTSMAVPHVTGVVALLAARNITHPDVVPGYLRAMSEDLGYQGWDPEYGYGLVNIGLLPGPSLTIISPQPGEIVPSGRPYTVSWDPVPDAVRYQVLFARSASKPWTQVAMATATSAEWPAPTVGAPLTTGRLQVAAYAGDGTLLSVDTRLDFAIRSIHITAPVVGAWFSGGDTVRLEWDVYRTPRKVARIAVDRSANGGRTWKRLKKFSRSVRSYDWVAPQVVAPRSLQFRVVLYDRDGRKIAGDAVAFDLLPAVP